MVTFQGIFFTIGGPLEVGQTPTPTPTPKGMYSNDDTNDEHDDNDDDYHNYMT